MGTTDTGLRTTFKAAVDLTNYQWCFVQAGSEAGEVTVCTGGSLPGPIGILENSPCAAEAATVCIFGITKVSASARASAGAAASAIAMGGNLVSGSVGKAVKGAGSPINAIALESVASGGGGVIKVFLLSPGSTLVGTNVV